MDERSKNGTWKNFWDERWSHNEIGFHQHEFEPNLVEFGAKLPKGKVLVPLCGKSLDMLWLARNGWQVVGVELSPLACEAFFTENKLAYDVRNEGAYRVFTGEGGVTIWCGDFFALPPKVYEGVVAVYDRASLIALPPELREKHAAFMTGPLAAAAGPKLAMLLLFLSYDKDMIDPPPFSIEPDEIRERFGKKFKITELNFEPEEVPLEEGGRFAGKRRTQYTYLLTANG